MRNDLPLLALVATCSLLLAAMLTIGGVAEIVGAGAIVLQLAVVIGASRCAS